MALEFAAAHLQQACQGIGTPQRCIEVLIMSTPQQPFLYQALIVPTSQDGLSGVLRRLPVLS